MCGIAGYLNFDKQRKADEMRVRSMTNSIAHRGPDSEGIYINGNIGLGHRRLSIIDLNTGDQPMSNKEKTVFITFNGEIYNYIELRDELSGFGYTFMTESDTEVIIKAYECWGTDCLSRLNGCWAFALYDLKRELLFISRDRIGEKPLFYSEYEGSFVFGSEIKSLFSFGIPRTIRSELIELYLVFTNVPGPDTFFRGIHKLLPGHSMIVTNNGIRIHKYWDLPDVDEKSMLQDKDKVYDEFAVLLMDSVRIRMRSDVSYGAFLSGGLDSSSIVAIMSKTSELPVETFTIGFEDKSFDESELASEVSDMFSTNHSLNIVKPEAFDTSLKKICYHFDEPFGDSSAIPTGVISSFARQKVKMVLTGDGGDEVLSGYNSYQGIKLASQYNAMPSFLKRSIPVIAGSIGILLKGKYRYSVNRIKNVASTASLDFNERILRKLSYTDFDSIKELVAPIKESIKAEDYFTDLMSDCSFKDDFYKLMYLHFKHNLPDDYLVKVDRMSMANSLEARIPFLDHRLIEFMCKVHKDVKMQGYERKSVLRNTIGKSLPKSLLRASKKGFGVPVREWFKSDAFNDKLTMLKKSGLPLDQNVLARIIDNNKNGFSDNGNFLWSVFVLNEILS